MFSSLLNMFRDIDDYFQSGVTSKEEIFRYKEEYFRKNTFFKVLSFLDQYIILPVLIVFVREYRHIFGKGVFRYIAVLVIIIFLQRVVDLIIKMILYMTRNRMLINKDTE